MEQRTIIDPRETIDVGKVIKEVFAAVGSPAQYQHQHVEICDRWDIVVHRRWDLEQDRAESLALRLWYGGPQKGKSIIAEIQCEDLAAVMAATSRLIEDCKRMVWNPQKEYWVFA